MQQAREMVLEIIREKDQADFRGVRGDFGARAGGGSIEVCLSCGLFPRQTGRTLVSSLTLTEWALVHLQSQGGCEEGPRESHSQREGEGREPAARLSGNEAVILVLSFASRLFLLPRSRPEARLSRCSALCA